LAVNRLFLTLPCLAMTGCVIGGDKWPRPRDLAPSWLVDRTRILAVAANPPEIAPGETATFEALIPDPGGEGDLSRLWFACPEVDGGFGCNLDLSTGSGTTATGTGTDGFIGLEPFIPPVYTAPDDLLDGITDPSDLAEGVNVLIQIAALPPEFLEAEPGETPDIDFNAIEVGYKRLVVSQASTPNRNPEIFEFVIDRIPLLPESVVQVVPGQSYELGVVLEEELVEEYEYLNSDGVIEIRREEPYATWFATDGEVFEPITLYPYNESTWTAPDEFGVSGFWYSVVRDRRGGMAWHVQAWETAQ